MARSIHNLMYLIETRLELCIFVFQRRSISQVELRLTIQAMIDAVFRMSGFLYWYFFPSSSVDTILGVIIENSLVLLASALNAYIYVIFNRYIAQCFKSFVSTMFTKMQITVIFILKAKQHVLFEITLKLILTKISYFLVD